MSSVIKAYHYNSNGLEITFPSGKVYRYHTPIGLYLDMLEIESKGGSLGKYFNSNIRPCYQGEKMN